jgi:hypothetical protein
MRLKKKTCGLWHSLLYLHFVAWIMKVTERKGDITIRWRLRCPGKYSYEWDIRHVELVSEDCFPMKIKHYIPSKRLLTICQSTYIAEVPNLQQHCPAYAYVTRTTATSEVSPHEHSAPVEHPYLSLFLHFLVANANEAVLCIIKIWRLVKCYVLHVLQYTLLVFMLCFITYRYGNDLWDAP